MVAVVALLEVLVDQLPVRRHVVLGPAADRQLADPVPLQLGVAAQPGLDLRAQMVFQRAGVTIQAHPDQALPYLRPHRVQAVAPLVDIGHRRPARPDRCSTGPRASARAWSVCRRTPAASVLAIRPLSKLPRVVRSAATTTDTCWPG